MPLYGLVDCARDPGIFPLLRREPVQRSLFSGTLDPELASVSPHIVQLDPGSPFREALETRGWGDNWGIVCASDSPLRAVRHQLRKNLQAMLPDGTAVLFRFYDPRVFRPYIESCPAADLPAWFGAITGYWVPGPEGTTLYQCPGGVLSVQPLVAAGA